jgi:hypothetical protein
LTILVYFSYLYPFPVQVKPSYHHPFCKLLSLLKGANKANNRVSLICNGTRSCKCSVYYLAKSTEE